VNGQLEVVAMGARTPVGLTAETSAAAVRAGIARLEEYPFILDSGEPLTAARDARLDPSLHGASRTSALLASVLDEVDRKLGSVSGFVREVHVYLSLPQSRPSFSDDDIRNARQIISSHFQSKELNTLVEIVGYGHAAAILAVEHAMQAHKRGDDILSVVLAVESYLDPQTLIWLHRQRLLAQPSCPNGFVPGEAAACLVLSGTRLRKHANWPCLAVLRGIGIGHEVQLRDCEFGSSGAGMTHAVLEATDSLDGDEIDTMYIDLNGERYRSEEWGFVVLRTPELWRSLDYEAPAACWGDVGSAWASLGGVLAVRSFMRGYARGPRALVMAGSVDGLRGAMLLQDPRLG
jgi:3-oxoacyl-[acyl-carrier-protein] synthase-1